MILALLLIAAVPALPPTPMQPVTDEYFGTKVIDHSPRACRPRARSSHGMGTPLNAQVAEMVDVLAFAADQVGLKVVPLKVAPAK